MNKKINCQQIQHYWKPQSEKILLDVRTYVCAHGKCKINHNRSHRRISNYNWNKMKYLPAEYIKDITKKADEIVNNWWQITEDKHKTMEIVKEEFPKECVYCQNPKLTGIKHIHFVKEKNYEKKLTDKKNKPIEAIFNDIDNMAEDNNVKAIKTAAVDAPGKPILQKNNYRMSYGDLNYLGSNKAILYFDRGIRGKQLFTNSVYPLEHHPKNKDRIVVDDIVFTSTCKCDSAKQHDRMFPHFRVTCAVGLTCPARLSIYEKISYARNRNASTEVFTTARAMLTRLW